MRKQRGITLVELLITLAVVSVLLGVVFPGFRGLMDRNSLTTTANAMVLAINYARSEALQNAGPVRVRAVDSSDASNEWGGGWNVERNGEVLRVFEPIAEALVFDGVAGVAELGFNSRGLLESDDPVELDLCLPGTSGVRITVVPTGRASTSSLDVAACPATS